MPRHLHILIAALVLLLAVSAGASATRSLVTAPALAQEEVTAPGIDLDQTLRPWDHPAMGGRVAVLGVVQVSPATPAPATPLPALSADAVVARAGGRAARRHLPLSTDRER